MLLVDRIKQNQEVLEKNPKAYIWSCIQEVDNFPMFFEIRKQRTSITISCRAINGTGLIQEDIANSYINNTIAEDIVRVLDSKDWRFVMSDVPQAQLDVVINAGDKSMVIEDMMISDFSAKEGAYETKLMMFLEDLCANVGCKTLKALPSRSKNFRGVVKREDASSRSYKNCQMFDEKSYERFLDKNKFTKGFLSSFHTKEVSSLFCLFDMKRGGFGVFNERTKNQLVLDHIKDNEKSM